MNFKELLDKWTRGEIDPPPVVRLIGAELVGHGDATATVRIDAGSRHHNAMGTVHGGILCDLADVAMGVAMATVMDDGATFTTLNLQMSYFRRVTEGRLTAVARTVRRGRTTAYCECDIFDESKASIAKGNSTCLIVTP